MFHNSNNLTLPSVMGTWTVLGVCSVSKSELWIHLLSVHHVACLIQGAFLGAKKLLRHLNYKHSHSETICNIPLLILHKHRETSAVRSCLSVIVEFLICVADERQICTLSQRKLFLITNSLLATNLTNLWLNVAVSSCYKCANFIYSFICLLPQNGI